MTVEELRKVLATLPAGAPVVVRVDYPFYNFTVETENVNYDQQTNEAVISDVPI